MDDSLAMKFVKLQEELSLASLEKDINDELSWIEDNITVCKSEDYFDDVISVQVLQKKLQVSSNYNYILHKLFLSYYRRS